MLDLKVMGGTVIFGRGSSQLDIGVSDGRVVGLYEPGASPEAQQSVEADGLMVLPGIVDAHFHCRAPGHPEREDFDSGTQAAAAGGATTVLEMPIAWPGVHNGTILRERRELGEQHAHVDFGLWGGGGADSESDIREMAEEGAIGYKIFLHAAPAGREKEFEGLTAVDNASLLRALRWIAATGLPAAVHSEDDELIQTLTAELRAAGAASPADHERSRPDYVEAVAVTKVLLMGEAAGTTIHLPHISSAKAVGLVADAKRRGVNVTLETCPHYLLFDDSIVGDLGPFAKINPPLRPKGNREALWAGIADGTVDVVGSDHAPYKVEEKEVGWTDIYAAPAGSPSIETMGPVLWDAALGRELTFSRCVELLSERPAQIFSLAPQKGAIAPGADADFILFDPNDNWTVKADDLLSRSRHSARLFDGRTFRGRIRATYLRGEVAYEGQKIRNRPGAGRFVRPLTGRAIST